jgi:hypothetical protein
MSWSPLAGLPNPIIVDAAGTAGSGYVLVAYLSGVTPSTPNRTSLAIDSSGSSPQATITANADGIWEVSGTEVIPHIDRKCQWAIFANATDAIANTPAYMGFMDNVEQTSTTGLAGGSIANITALKALTGQVNDEVVTIIGHTVDGIGGGEFYFDSSSSATDDNGMVIQPDTGTGRWLRVVTGDPEVAFWGAVGDGLSSGGGTVDSTAIAAAFTNSDVVYFKNYGTTTTPTRYRIGSTITVGGNVTIISDGAVINKEFNGIGMEFTGGSNYAHIMGHLIVEGVGAFNSDTSNASTNPTAHGVKFTGSRIRVSGFFYSQANEGNGFEIESNSGNMNSCEMNTLIADNNGMAGINCTSTQDDCAVWNYIWRARNNRLQGVNFNTNWLGRAHNGTIYTEGNAFDSTTNAGTFIGKLRNSKLFIYAEETRNTSPRAINLDAACINLLVHDARQSKTTVSPTATFNGCKVVAGGENWAGGQGNEAFHGRLKLADAGDSGSQFSDSVVINSASNLVAKDRFAGDGTRAMWAVDPADTVGTESVMSGTTHITRVSIDGTTAPQDLLIQTKTEVNPGIDNTYSLGLTLFRWTKGFMRELILGTVGTTLFSEAGTPEGNKTANVGSMYLRTDGGAGTTLYIKETGSGNTGWAAK